MGGGMSYGGLAQKLLPKNNHLGVIKGRNVERKQGHLGEVHSAKRVIFSINWQMQQKFQHAVLI